MEKGLGRPENRSGALLGDDACIGEQSEAGRLQGGGCGKSLEGKEAQSTRAKAAVGKTRSPGQSRVGLSVGLQTTLSSMSQQDRGQRVGWECCPESRPLWQAGPHTAPSWPTNPEALNACLPAVCQGRADRKPSIGTTETATMQEQSSGPDGQTACGLCPVSWTSQVLTHFFLKQSFRKVFEL